MATVDTQKQPTAVDLILNPAAAPPYDFAFADFLKREYDFSLAPNRQICKAYQQGLCPLGEKCPDKHPHQSNYTKYAPVLPTSPIRTPRQKLTPLPA